jgi:hypothetical protein
VEIYLFERNEIWQYLRQGDSMTTEKYLVNIKGDNFSRDPDHTKTARTFYAEYWKTTISDNIDDYNGMIGNYRGDTIISFNTVAGCMIRLLSIYNSDFKIPKTAKKRLDIIEEANDVSDTLKKYFNEFFNIYHSLANFMPLMQSTINLNKIKASHYHDYPDLFFKDLSMRKPWFFEDKLNAEYINKFNGRETFWETFVESNYLQSFFMKDNTDSYSNFIQLAPSDDIKMPYKLAISKNFSEREKNNCKEYIEKFLINSISIIRNRAKHFS